MDLPDLGKLTEMLSQAKEMQEEMDDKLAAATVEATSGGGVVTVRMSGKKELLKLKIDPAVLGSSTADLELLEDLIIAAVNEAGRRADALAQANTQALMGGLNLPGLGS